MFYFHDDSMDIFNVTVEICHLNSEVYCQSDSEYCQSDNEYCQHDSIKNVIGAYYSLGKII